MRFLFLALVLPSKTVTFTVKNGYFYSEKWDLAVFLLFFADFGPQDGVLEPSVDCKKGSGVVSEQVPGSSECV